MKEASFEETAEPKSSEELFYIYPAGLFPGMLVSAETIRKAGEAEARREEEKNNKRNKPPKPPRRPNARIGRLAVEGGF